MSILPIRTFDDPVLRRPCREVTAFTPQVRRELGDLIHTFRHTQNCCGLAANQLGLSWRLVVIDVGRGLLTLVNPRILKAQGEQIVEEGCMSFPGVWGKKRRPAKVIVHALTPRGQDLVLRGEGLLAQCLCHEIEHLDGIVFCDDFLPEEGEGAQ